MIHIFRCYGVTVPEAERNAPSTFKLWDGRNRLSFMGFNYPILWSNFRGAYAALQYAGTNIVRCELTLVSTQIPEIGSLLLRVDPLSQQLSCADGTPLFTPKSGMITRNITIRGYGNRNSLAAGEFDRWFIPLLRIDAIDYVRTFDNPYLGMQYC